MIDDTYMNDVARDVVLANDPTTNEECHLDRCVRYLDFTYLLNAVIQQKCYVHTLARSELYSAAYGFRMTLSF